MFPKEESERRVEIPEDLTPEEERAILMALERYFSQESPKPTPWVLQGRVDATGHGVLQVRKYSRHPWNGVEAAFVRHGVASLNGRGDVR